MSLPYGQEYDEDGFPIDPGCTPPIDTGAPHRPDLHVYRDAPGVHPDPSQCGYIDVATLLDAGIPEPPAPDICLRRDGVGLFYSGQYNVVFGDPESGKTLLCDYATVQVLAAGGRVLRLDLDHNGPQSTISRLIDFGADEDTLRDPDRFLYVEPADRVQMAAIVEHQEVWKPALAIVDSIGELMPLYGAGSNSADEFTDVHSRVIKPLTRTGACVIAIDHLSKGADSRKFGATGTAAKKRAIGGTSIRVSVDSAFTPDKGGSAYLAIHKDRHGGLRRRSPGGDKEPLAGKFTILGNEQFVSAPMPDEHNPSEQADPEDVAAVAALDPPPKSARDTKSRLNWRDERARLAYKTWKENTTQ